MARRDVQVACALQRIAEQLARQFRRETRYDFVPFHAGEDTPGCVVLLPSRRVLIGYARLIAGAVGIQEDTKGWGATWVYVHPHERGVGHINAAWPFITDRWPGIRLRGPFTKAGAALRDHLEGKT